MAAVLVYVAGDRIGDAIVKYPVVRALRAALPAHRLIWMAGRRSSAFAGPLAPLAAGVIDEVREAAGVGLRARELLRRPLAGERFDVVIDTQHKLLTTLVLRRVAHRLFLSPAAGYRFSDRRPAPGPRPRAVRARFAELCALAAGRPLAIDPRIDPGPEYAHAAAHLLPPGPCYVGLAPGAGGEPKRWPLQAYLALARRLAGSGRVPVFFLGPAERDWRQGIAAAVPQALFPEHAHRGPPASGPVLAIALGARLAAAVANDAGPGHLLAASGCPVVTLFGRTDPGKFAGEANRIVVRARAVQAITVDTVAAALAGPLGGAAP